MQGRHALTAAQLPYVHMMDLAHTRDGAFDITSQYVDIKPFGHALKQDMGTAPEQVPGTVEQQQRDQDRDQRIRPQPSEIAHDQRRRHRTQRSKQVAHDVQAVEQAKGRGSMPGGLTRWAATVLAPPTVAWDRVLRAAVRRAVAERAGRVDYTYSRPSRRRLPGIIKPAMRAPSVIVSVVVDTSGSMSQADLDAAMGEVHGVLRSSGVAREHVRLLSCDAAATTAQRVRSATSVRLSGGGGTDMRIGIAAAEAATPAPHVVIVLTDGDTPWPEAPTRARLVCAVISNRDPHGTPQWATTVHIPPAT